AAPPPIVEPGLPDLLREVVGTGRLRATTSSDHAVAESDLSLICVGTPSRANGRLDVDAVVRTGQSIGQAVRKRAEPHTVVLRSTVLPGTAEQYLVPALLAGAGGRAATRLAVNPEFMREGPSPSDFARPPMALAGWADAGSRAGRSTGQAGRKRAEPHTVVLRSTVLPGTAEQYLVPALLAGAGGRAATRLAVNPEFMREGSSLSDFARPPMTLVGCGDP